MNRRGLQCIFQCDKRDSLPGMKKGAFYLGMESEKPVPGKREEEGGGNLHLKTRGKQKFKSRDERERICILVWVSQLTCISNIGKGRVYIQEWKK